MTPLHWAFLQPSFTLSCLLTASETRTKQKQPDWTEQSSCGTAVAFCRSCFLSFFRLYALCVHDLFPICQCVSVCSPSPPGLEEWRTPMLLGSVSKDWLGEPCPGGWIWGWGGGEKSLWYLSKPMSVLLCPSIPLSCFPFFSTSSFLLSHDLRESFKRCGVPKWDDFSPFFILSLSLSLELTEKKSPKPHCWVTHSNNCCF